ncbi:centromere protein O-like [Mercenaria mercenaria]|uniref:centromere protein O-like n=1 Tax=Mercenaria mercenaria TaxID=6596 RepID=UPI00234E55BF|nr:centromere protein O-like [Mercenaria mercenaria]
MRMDYLDEQEDREQRAECMNRLRKRKQFLLERLEILHNKKFDVEEYKVVDSSVQQEVLDCLEILDSYRLLGVCIKSMGPDLVLRFDPLYKNQYPTTEHYSVQLLRKGGNFELGKHNLPPFIPANQLLEKYLANGIAEFVEETRNLLYAYVQRREGLKYTQETFGDNIKGDLDVNLAVSYVKLQLCTSDRFPELEVTLQYSLEKCLPDTVNIKPAEDEETYSVSKKMLERKVEKWRQIFLNQDIFTAVSDIVKEKS